ncbi:hypothetical protein GXP65_10610 [Vibrio campbellii]|uniref:DUF5677 domain-containing protein n=1 Tax=Vibrio sp. LB10LO1 TaxID=2711207 RepID=UPI001389D1C6|nr:DUF5677 domain-containing protein [Vibrio sp. LB10LO1]NDJ81478.1 hypothetical protein [Vibrio sp. LB10LO1]
MELLKKEVAEFIEQSWKIIAALEDFEADKNQMVIVKLWVKFIRNNEAILELFSKGFYDEGMTIYRLSIEHLFNIFALARNKDFLQKFINNSEKSIPKAMVCLHEDLKKEDKSPLTPENKNRLEKAIDNNRSKELDDLGYSIYNASQESELNYVYNSSYRILSISYAHSTYLSAVSNASSEEIRPILEDMRDSLHMVILLSREVFVHSAPNA